MLHSVTGQESSTVHLVIKLSHDGVQSVLHRRKLLS